MTRQLPLLVALCLLYCITLKAHPSLTNYRSGWDSDPDNAPAFTRSFDWNDLSYNAGKTKTGISLLSNEGTNGMILAPVDPCTTLYSDGFESSFGNWIDGGSNCARSNSFPNTGSWSVELRAGIGLTSSMYTPALNLTGVGVTLSFSYYPQGYETGEGIMLEYATDAGGTFSGYTAWVRGTHFDNNIRYNVSVTMNNVTWTSTSRLRLRNIASATDDRVYIDDVVISNCCQVGASCNDNNQCTTGDIIQANCQCAGTYQDSDSDGTCDAFDICPGVDDYQVQSQAPCDDGDPCTVGDHLMVETCACGGQFVDWDHDGYCATEDPNDVDACIPDPQNPACNPCTTHDYAHFESNFGNWNSGGSDGSRVYASQYASAGNYCVRIRDNSGASSSVYSDNFNLAGLNNVSVSFFFKAVSMEVNEDFFLEVSTNGGSSYTIFESWSRGTDFQNNSLQYAWVALTGITWTNQSRFRIRCDASADDDQVYIDEITIKSCLNYPAFQADGEISKPEINNNSQGFNMYFEDVIISPNPVATELRFSGMIMDETSIDIFNTSGRLIRNVVLNKNTLDVSQLPPGLYFVRIEKESQWIVKRFVKE
ncbi:MAG TPA: T9SS type A sorting domain-containing protein [Saprospiraceae bacterium]|nr:T9SS type A sorting domain-containing protein [Saprospiraceae bacterium]